MIRRTLAALAALSFLVPGVAFAQGEPDVPIEFIDFTDMFIDGDIPEATGMLTIARDRSKFASQLRLENTFLEQNALDVQRDALDAE